MEAVGSVKCRSASTRLHSGTFQKTAIFILVAVRTLDPASMCVKSHITQLFCWYFLSTPTQHTVVFYRHGGVGLGVEPLLQLTRTEEN
jgi:hypothetical protein